MYFDWLTVLSRKLLAPEVRLRWLPLLLVWLLFLVAWLPQGHAALRLLLLAQLGLLLLWQPVYAPQRDMNAWGLAGMALAALALAMFAGPALLLGWAALVAALVGGRAAGMSAPGLRRLHLGLALLVLLLLWLQLLPAALLQAPPWPRAVSYLLPAGLLLLAVWPIPAAEPPQAQPLDFLYSLLLLLLTLLVSLGTAALVRGWQYQYVAALATMLVATGGLLAALALLWNPLGGFAGIGALFSAQLFQLGSPFELWSARVTAHYGRETDAEVFLQAALRELLMLPWVAGGHWLGPGGEGEFGVRRGAGVSLKAGDLQLVLSTRGAITTAHRLQLQLAVRLLEQLYLAKQREARLAEHVYIEAVYETGARLTHDIKNLLQALQGLIGAAQISTDPHRLASLYARQLPEIGRRLEVTLGKLSAPLGGVEDVILLPAQDWWERVAIRYANSGIALAPLAPGCPLIDVALYDCVIDNLLQNAMNKRAMAGELVLRAGLDASGRLWVEDDGMAVDAALAERLLLAPVESNTGFGLGLYQAASLAKARGGRLQLVENQPGKVRFELQPGV
ncbi:hypothetical protein GCM10007907_28590 [Chitinimonas prasina]|uniref:HAMP domain-containing histidine kinase n=1 Tax=Chitinimonas prasina TaxID=1434937 RepID=A0ABQ5YMC5_9NEIS|nr:hypothetical protein [Chitinimonas prasina]GLR14069.1 hypothetical protein GCM10007907_28590 [Chitinimonas prasina]